MDLNYMADECNEISRSKGWLEEKRSFGDLIALMHSELSEALEEFRNGHELNEIYLHHSNACPVGQAIAYAGDKPPFEVACNLNGCKPEGIPIELADTLIRILQACGEFSIDIQKAYDVKTYYNMTRPHRHGGKKI